MRGTIDSVVQPSSVFKFKEDYLTFEIDLAPSQNVEFCIVFDSSVDLNMPNVINAHRYDIRLKGGSLIDTGKWASLKEPREQNELVSN